MSCNSDTYETAGAADAAACSTSTDGVHVSSTSTDGATKDGHLVIRDLLLSGEYKPSVNFEHQLGSEAELAVPTPDHYLSLPYIVVTRTSSELPTFPVEGMDGGSVSMLAVQVGS